MQQRCNARPPEMVLIQTLYLPCHVVLSAAFKMRRIKRISNISSYGTGRVDGFIIRCRLSTNGPIRITMSGLSRTTISRKSFSGSYCKLSDVVNGSAALMILTLGTSSIESWTNSSSTFGSDSSSLGGALPKNLKMLK